MSTGIARAVRAQRNAGCRKDIGCEDSRVGVGTQRTQMGRIDADYADGGGGMRMGWGWNADDTDNTDFHCETLGCLFSCLLIVDSLNMTRSLLSC